MLQDQAGGGSRSRFTLVAPMLQALQDPLAPRDNQGEPRILLGTGTPILPPLPPALVRGQALDSLPQKQCQAGGSRFPCPGQRCLRPRRRKRMEKAVLLPLLSLLG